MYTLTVCAWEFANNRIVGQFLSLIFMLCIFSILVPGPPTAGDGENDLSAFVLPKRTKRTETPVEREATPQKFVKMVNPYQDQQDDEGL